MSKARRSTPSSRSFLCSFKLQRPTPPFHLLIPSSRTCRIWTPSHPLSHPLTLPRSLTSRDSFALSEGDQATLLARFASPPLPSDSSQGLRPVVGHPTSSPSLSPPQPPTLPSTSSPTSTYFWTQILLTKARIGCIFYLSLNGLSTIVFPRPRMFSISTHVFVGLLNMALMGLPDFFTITRKKRGSSMVVVNGEREEREEEEEKGGGRIRQDVEVSAGRRVAVLVVEKVQQ